MNMRNYRKRTWLVLFVMMFLVFLMAGPESFAPASAQSGTRSGYVNDFAGVIDDETRTKLSTILENVKLKTGIDFAIVTVNSTDGKDISDFLRRLARDWNVGARDSSKSLLMVVAVNEKDSLAQFSRSAQLVLPEGVLADMHQRMRGFISSGQYNEGVAAGVGAFVKSLASHV